MRIEIGNYRLVHIRRRRLKAFCLICLFVCLLATVEGGKVGTVLRILTLHVYTYLDMYTFNDQVR